MPNYIFLIKSMESSNVPIGLEVLFVWDDGDDEAILNAYSDITPSVH